MFDDFSYLYLKLLIEFKLFGNIRKRLWFNRPSSDSIRFGSLNNRSAVHKAALLHDTISDFRLNVLALQETWITADASLAVKADIAPDGFSAIHVQRRKNERGRSGARVPELCRRSFTSP